MQEIKSKPCNESLLLLVSEILGDILTGAAIVLVDSFNTDLLLLEV
jgi:hypothetical protein